MLISICVATLDGSIANVALPTISREFDVTPASSIWIVNGFQFAMGAMLFASASLGELVGFARMWRIGLILFTVSSLLCALAHGLPELVGARVLQGLGAAMLMSNQPSLLRLIYPARLLGRGIGWIALAVATCSAAGPTVGGAILAVASWQWLFLVNVPLGLLALLLSFQTLPRRTIPSMLLQFDVLGAFWIALSLSAFSLGIQALAPGSTPWAIALAFTLSFGALALYARHARRIARPLLPLEVFTRPAYTLSALTSVCSFTALGLAIVSLPFFFQTVMGRSALEAGLLLTPWMLSVAIVAPIAGRLADRYPVWVLATSGLTTMAVGAALLALIALHPSVGEIIWGEVICGLGFGFFQTPNNRELLSSVPREQSGAASGMLSTARIFGTSLGAALVAVVFGLLTARTPQGGSHAEAIARATPITLWIACALAMLGAGVSLLRNQSQKSPHAIHGVATRD